MNNITELAKKARELKSKGFSTGEISDELNISKETALWLLTHEIKEGKTEQAPRDVYINWQKIGTSALRLHFLSLSLVDLILDFFNENKIEEEIDAVVGIANSGIPIASYAALELETSLALVVPKKRIWEPEKEKLQSGYILGNFSDLKNKNAVIIDDIITTGSTTKEVIELVRASGGKPLIAGVLLDKAGVQKIADVPVVSLLNIALL